LELEASAKEEFEEKLMALPSDVGSRLRRRSQEKKENFAIKHYFLILSKSDKIEYPIKLRKSESPDYLVEENGKNYGIEITEATFEAYQYLLTENERQPGMRFEPDAFIYGEEYPIETVTRFLKPHGTRLAGRGWGGTEAELYASGWARDSLIKKLVTISRWPAESKKELRILLYQNCPAWLHDIHALGRLLKKRICESQDSGALNLSGIKVDYLSSDGGMVVIDASGSCESIDMSKSDWSVP
jgi:hypothetical protein